MADRTSFNTPSLRLLWQTCLWVQVSAIWQPILRAILLARLQAVDTITFLVTFLINKFVKSPVLDRR